VPGTTSTPASIMRLFGPARTTMSCGRWSAFVTTLISPPLTNGCSRVVTTRPYNARRDAPLSRRQTRHNERSSETRHDPTTPDATPPGLSRRPTRHNERSSETRHDPTTPDATPLSPDARRDTTNVRLKLRAVPSVCSFITSQIWNLQRLAQ
jgi:hypothetical protein